MDVEPDDILTIPPPAKQTSKQQSSLPSKVTKVVFDVEITSCERTLSITQIAAIVGHVDRDSESAVSTQNQQQDVKEQHLATVCKACKTFGWSCFAVMWLMQAKIPSYVPSLG